MRWLGRLALLALLGLGVWLLLPYWYNLDLPERVAQGGEDWKLELVPRSSIATGYLAEPDRWLTFPVPPAANRVRIVSNANLRDIDAARAARAADPQKRWHYALEVEVLDRAGRPILQRVHHHRANFSEVREPSGKIVPPAFYLAEELAPASGVVLNVSLAGLPRAARLRVRAAGADPQVADVLVRVYFPERTSERDVARLWQRMSEKQKELLAKGSVHAPELLIEEERRNLIRNLWQPTGPLGVQGPDFRARQMYVLRDLEGDPVDEPIAPAGIVSAPGQVAVFPIPEGGGQVSFEGVPLPASAGGAEPAAAASLRGRWFGTNTFARDDLALAWTEPGAPMTIELSGGLVELEAPVPLALRAYMDVAGERTEITPERLYQRLFFADRERPIIFAIAHHGERPTPIRIEARYLVAAGGERPPPRLRYEFLAADDKPLAAGELSLVATLSRYDRALGETVATRVTDLTEAFFSVPREAVRLRLSAAPDGEDGAAPVLVGAASRPHGLARDIRLPEDQFAFAAKGEKVPAWFSIRPIDYERLVADNGSQLIVVQPRPPEDKPEVQAGRFGWEDFRPNGNWRARQLLAPRDPRMPLREEALVSVFRPIAAGATHRLTFPTYLGVRQLRPSLVWVAPDEKPFAATVSVDGRPQHRFRGSSRYGETRLPPLPAGQHRVRVEMESGAAPRFFINHTEPGGDAYVTQMAAHIDKEVAFDIERTGRVEETVTARLFQPAGWQGRTLLRARIEGPPPPPLVPLPGWLFEERLFDVRPDPSYAAPVFDTRGAKSDAGRPAYIPFPADVPPGRYRIVFSVEAGPPGYLAVSRLTPGVANERRVLEEPEARHVVVE